MKKFSDSRGRVGETQIDVGGAVVRAVFEGRACLSMHMSLHQPRGYNNWLVARHDCQQGLS